jgi:hypothetical protein
MCETRLRALRLVKHNSIASVQSDGIRNDCQTGCMEVARGDCHGTRYGASSTICRAASLIWEMHRVWLGLGVRIASYWRLILQLKSLMGTDERSLLKGIEFHTDVRRGCSIPLSQNCESRQLLSILHQSSAREKALSQLV